MLDLNGTIRLSGRDLANQAGCRRLTQLERDAVLRRVTPPRTRPVTLPQGTGLSRRYVEQLEAEGLRPVYVEGGDLTLASEATGVAMRVGAPVIIGARFEYGRWYAEADILRRIEEPSALGSWSYEAIDTRLFAETEQGTILRLCLYSDLVGGIQGRTPEQMHWLSPGDPFEVRSFRFADHAAHYLKVCEQLLADVDGGAQELYPHRVPHCAICRWAALCDRER